MYGRFRGLLGHGSAGGSSLMAVPLAVPEQADHAGAPANSKIPDRAKLRSRCASSADRDVE